MIKTINARPKMIDLSNLHGIELEKARGFNTACVHWEAYDKDREKLVPLDVGQACTILSFLLGEYREKGLYENYPQNFNRLILEFSKDFCKIFGQQKAGVPSVNDKYFQELPLKLDGNSNRIGTHILKSDGTLWINNKQIVFKDDIKASVPSVSEQKLWNIIFNVLQKNRKLINTKQLFSPEEIDARLTNKLTKAIHNLLTANSENL